MKKTEEPINVNIIDGEPFFAHELTVNFTPTQFTFDFKCITPRNDPRSKSTSSFLLKHNVIMTDPWHAKSVLSVLSTMIEKYEKEFGKITKPKALERAEKKCKKLLEKQTSKGMQTPDYMG